MYMECPECGNMVEDVEENDYYCPYCHANLTEYYYNE